MDDKKAETSSDADKILDCVKRTMRKMKEPLTAIATSNMDEKAIGDAIKSISDISLELAKNAFAIGSRSGGDAMKESCNAFLDAVCKRFFNEHVRKEGQ